MIGLTYLRQRTASGTDSNGSSSSNIHTRHRWLCQWIQMKYSSAVTVVMMLTVILAFEQLLLVLVVVQARDDDSSVIEVEQQQLTSSRMLHDRRLNKELIGECDLTKDCDRDSDCQKGLLCASDHRSELINRTGIDIRGAYCTNTVQLKPWNWEVCYDPAKLNKSPPIIGSCSVDYKCSNFRDKTFFLCEVRGSNVSSKEYFNECVCDVDVDKQPFCWQNARCEQYTKRCNSNSDCDKNTERCFFDDTCCNRKQKFCFRKCFNPGLPYNPFTDSIRRKTRRRLRQSTLIEQEDEIELDTSSLYGICNTTTLGNCPTMEQEEKGRVIHAKKYAL